MCPTWGRVGWMGTPLVGGGRYHLARYIFIANVFRQERICKSDENARQRSMYGMIDGKGLSACAQCLARRIERKEIVAQTHESEMAFVRMKITSRVYCCRVPFLRVSPIPPALSHGKETDDLLRSRGAWNIDFTYHHE